MRGLLAAGALAAAACATPPDPAPFRTGAELRTLGVDEQRAFDAAARTSEVIERVGGVLDDPELEAYATEILGRLFPQFPGAFRVRVLTQPVVNAITLANGSIYLFTGLVARMESEAQLASVLAHEGVHFTHRHTYAERARARSPLVGSSVKYGRAQEEQADRAGLSVLAGAGYAPGEAVRALEHLVEIRRLYDTEFDPDYATHPEGVRRVADMTRLAAEYPAGGRTERESYRLRTARARVAAIEESLARLDHRFVLLQLGEGALGSEYPPHADYFLGEAYRLRGGEGDGALAEAAYRRAAERAPDFAPTHRALGRLYLKRSEGELARAHLQRYLQLEPDAVDRAHVEADLARLAEAGR